MFLILRSFLFSRNSFVAFSLSDCTSEGNIFILKRLGNDRFMYELENVSHGNRTIQRKGRAQPPDLSDVETHSSDFSPFF